jgi:hypothetical protein
MAVTVIGALELERKLRHIADQGGKSVSRAAMTGAVAPMKKAIRRSVNTAPVSGAVKRAARATIGSSVKKQVGGYGAKAGFGVGKQTKAKKTKAHERNVYGQGGAKIVRGVGLSSANIHWFVLGTKERTVKSTGRKVGKIAPELEGLIPVAVNAARGEMISEAARRAAVALKREALKRR